MPSMFRLLNGTLADPGGNDDDDDLHDDADLVKELMKGVSRLKADREEVGSHAYHI